MSKNKKNRNKNLHNRDICFHSKFVIKIIVHTIHNDKRQA